MKLLNSFQTYMLRSQSELQILPLETITLKLLGDDVWLLLPNLAFGQVSIELRRILILLKLFLKYSFILAQEFSVFSNLVIDVFTDKAAMLNLLDLRSIMGCPRGHWLSIYAHSSGKKRTSLHISWEKGDHYYIQTRHHDLFFPLPSV